jgi:hypothetical protein
LEVLERHLFFYGFFASSKKLKLQVARIHHSLLPGIEADHPLIDYLLDGGRHLFDSPENLLFLLRHVGEHPTFRK